ncbi:MAG: DUF4010 domain-containing protein [Acidimicrobiia bacterium]|nr:DUF4010 domain-containing protein [Acidimicrobiia bacterium]MDH3396627.1 DUF4010 domain-containing protein [Acidimicrobiia bacterium]MDH5615522.1 DUF4010 domain-containing protein [Acidimicrobiia bacterium]
MDDTGSMLLAFVVASGLGAVIGLERQLHRHDTEDVSAGVRTYSLFGLWGAATGFFADVYGTAAFAVGAAAFAALIISSYVMFALGTKDWGTTTEFASLGAFAIGVLVWNDQVIVAAGVAVGIAALLRAKRWLHGLTDKFSDADVRAVLQFAVLTAVVLPLLPDQDYGPFAAFNPRRVWLMVVFVAAIGLAGYVALRLRGERGLAVTGLLGGLISSTAVTLGFSKISKDQPRLQTALVAGIIAASGLMHARVLVEAFVFAPDMALKLAVPLVVLFVLVEGTAVYWWTRPFETTAGNSGIQLKNPVTIKSALQFAALYAAVIFVAKVLIERASEAALSVVGAVSGINDVDAITLAMADEVRRQGLDPTVAAQAVLAAVIVNTLVKAGMAFVLGSKALGRSVAVTLIPAATLGVGSWFLL